MMTMYRLVPLNDSADGEKVMETLFFSLIFLREMR